MANRAFKRSLYHCTCPHHDWEKLLGGTVNAMVDASCCQRSKKEYLCVGVGLTKKDPSFLNWKCVNDACNECGVERKLGMTKCSIWKECTSEINVLEWVHAIRQGARNGKQNTQLEVQNRRYKVNKVIKKLEDSLQICQKHQAAYEWKTWMRQIDVQMSNPDKHCII